MAKIVLFVNKVNQVSPIPEILAGAGYEVTAVDDAGTGLRRLASQAYDMVILVENAAAESWLLCAGIRRLTASPLIVISPGAGAEDCVKAINAGADFFIRKPFGPMELIARVKALSPHSSALQPVPTVS